MTNITSYAQNFEDVMLWRALSHVENGFYIDIGAQDPVVDSISLLFYERGWCGIHVEPTPYYADLLRQNRAGDVVIQAAVGLRDEEVLSFFEIPQSGISTADVAIAERHRSNGIETRTIQVPCITLAGVFKSAGKRDIHWLKVDVEGLEYQVLASWGTTKVRPWIVVVESTLPLTRIESHQQWEPVLLGYGYTPVYFDGLNRFYISVDHPELKSAFALPPNIFDEFGLNGTANAPFHRLMTSRHQAELRAAQEAIQAAKAERSTEAANHSEQIKHLESELRRLQEELASRANEVMGLTSQHQVNLQAAHANAESARAEAAKAALNDGVRIKELEAALHQLRDELASRADEVTRLVSQHQAEIQSSYSTIETVRAEVARVAENERQASHAAVEAVRAEAARVAANDNSRIKDLESELGRQREELTRRAHELTVDLQVQRTALEATARASREKELLVREQGELLRASANREHLILARLELLHGQLAEAQRQERDLNARLLEYQDTARREIEALVVQHAAATRAHQEQELANRHQAELLREATSREHGLREQVALLLRQAAEQEARAHEQSERLLRELHAEREELATLKSSASWRLTAPLRLFAQRPEAIRADSVSFVAQSPTDGIPRSLPDRDTTTFGAPSLMSPQSNDRPPIKAAADINSLLALRHEDFVECAYRTIFERPVDPDGHLHYTKRVLNGDPKMEILRDLHASDEARAVGAELPWLRKAIARHVARNRPLRRLVRKLLSFGNARAHLAERIRTVDEKLDYFERQATSTRSQLTDRIRIVEEKLSDFESQSETIRTQLNRVLEMLSNPESHERKPALDTSARQDAAFLGRSLVAKRILREMSSAIREAKQDSATWSSP